MGRRGRPPQGPELVEGLEASSDAKDRLKLILRTLSGELSVQEACAHLGISEARFHELRAEALHGATQALEPKPKGRPPQAEPSEEAREVARLKAQVTELTIDLRAAQIREEIGLVAPHLLKRPVEGEAEKKKRPRWPETSSGGTNSTPSGSAGSSGNST